MNAIQKQQLLQNVNQIDLVVLKSILDQGFITLDEFKEAGLDYNKVEELDSINKIKEQVTFNASEKQNVLNAINNNQSTVDEIQMNLSNGIITLADLQQSTNLSPKSIQLLTNLNSAGRTTIFSWHCTATNGSAWNGIEKRRDDSKLATNSWISFKTSTGSV